MLDRRAVGDDEGPITAGARLRPERYAPSTWPEMDAAGGQYRHELGVRGKATAGDGGEERIGGRAVDGVERLPNDTLELVGAARPRRRRIEVHDDRIPAAYREEAIGQIRPTRRNDKGDRGRGGWRCRRSVRNGIGNSPCGQRGASSLRTPTAVRHRRSHIGDAPLLNYGRRGERCVGDHGRGLGSR